MGDRLRLAQALADGTLTGNELVIAKANRIVVQEAERIKMEAHKKIKMRLKDSEFKKEINNG